MIWMPLTMYCRNAREVPKTHKLITAPGQARKQTDNRKSDSITRERNSERRGNREVMAK